MMTLDQMILKAIPVNDKCAIEEQYNKLRRKLLKERFEDYLADQLSKQFNARPFIQKPAGNSDKPGLGEYTNGRELLQ
jgi:hypothetical protein